MKDMTDEEKETYIGKEIWEDAMNYVDVYPVSLK